MATEASENDAQDTSSESSMEQTTPEIRTKWALKDESGRVWDTRRTREQAEDDRSDYEQGCPGDENLSIEPFQEAQDRYHLSNGETGDEMAVFSFSESEAVHQAWLEWGITEDDVSVEEVEEFDASEVET